MKIAVIGSGAREHAIVYKLQTAASVKSILAIPGNDAMARTLDKVILQAMPEDTELGYKKLAASLKNQGIDYGMSVPKAQAAAWKTLAEEEWSSMAAITCLWTGALRRDRKSTRLNSSH